jgi:hypothetical protein
MVLFDQGFDLASKSQSYRVEGQVGSDFTRNDLRIHWPVLYIL